MDEEYLGADDNELPSDEGSERDDKSISSDLIRGHINTIILRALCDGDKYGYEIITEIERKSHGQYSIKQPSLYSALKRLEKDGYVTSYWGGSVGGGRRKYFSLTDEGRTIAEQNQSEWEYSRTVIDSLISDKDFDFSNPAPASVNMRVLKRTTSRVPGREGEDDELDFEPSFQDDAEREKLDREYEAKRAELAQEKAALEEERARFQEEMERQREELQRDRDDAAARAENEAQLEDKNIEQERYLEQIMREHEEQIERERAESEAKLNEERAEHEKALLEREARIRESIEKLEEERIAHEKALARQEARIREEQEVLFRQREQQLLHANYVNLVNSPAGIERDEPYTYFNSPVADASAEADKAGAARDGSYRTVVGSLYSNAVQPDDNPSHSAREDRAQLLGGIDFSDVHAKAVRDGIRITTAGGKPFKETSTPSESLINKGKALFFSGIITFFYCLVIGIIAIGVREQYSIPVFYPYFIWGSGLALLLITGLLYANHFGERSLRHSILVLINSIVIYVLVAITVLIVALIVPIDFFMGSDLVIFIAIPFAFFFAIAIFGICYYLQTRSKNH